MKKIILIGILIGFFVSSAQASKIQSADYVIVGVGTAGGYLAKKLTDDYKTSVIALHNGSNLNNEELIKFAENSALTLAAALSDSELYQRGYSIEQPEAGNRKILWLEALPLGGASSINVGGYCIGTPHFYAQWEAIAGAQWWSVQRIQDIYRQIEHYEGVTHYPFRGYLGSLNIRQEPNPTLVSTKFTQAIINATKLPFLLDYNDPNTPIGAALQMQTTQFGTEGEFRGSSSTVYLNQNVMTDAGEGIGRKLTVLFNSTASKVIWQGNKAVGVEYISTSSRGASAGPSIKKVYAKKAVILCAGLGSSPFLLRSGIGPKKLLNSLGIPVVFDNPNVGQRLIDQPMLILLFSTNIEDTPVPLDTNLAAIKHSELGKRLLDFVKQKTSLPPLLPTEKYQKTFFNQIAWLPNPDGDPNVRVFRFSAANITPGFAMAVFDLLQPKSYGSISINSRDPLVQPIIDLGMFQNPDDLALLTRGMQYYLIGINAELQAIDPSYQLIFPDPEILTDKFLLRDFIKQNIASNHCFVNHCRMAPLNQGGVVDSTGHVYGVENLLVADDSVVPVETDGSPMATAYLVAENIGRILLNQ